MIRIGFYEETLSFRGTTRSILAYADSIQCFTDDILCTYYFKRSEKNHIPSAKLFINKGIAIKEVNRKEDLKRENLDFLYYITAEAPGKINWLENSARKTLLHQVGFQPPDFNSSTYFAYASHWQSIYFTDGCACVLPHIVENPQDIRSPTEIDQINARRAYNLPLDAIVLGRHGGFDTWNLPFASKAVFEAVSKRNDLYFLFLNTPKFAEHPQIKFLQGTHNNLEREDFLNACDGMIHARWEGETFGLSCAEFLIRKKPIISWNESRERNHFFMAESSIIGYNNFNDLSAFLHSLDKKYLEHKSCLIPDWIQTRYSRESIARIFLDFIK